MSKKNIAAGLEAVTMTAQAEQPFVASAEAAAAAAFSQQPINSGSLSVPLPTPSVEQSILAATPKETRISHEDVSLLELAKARKETAAAQAREAAARSEVSEISYRYLVLQVYLKYGLNQTDALSEDGTIIRGGAIQQTTQR
jgi:hypothetical protein